MTTLVIPAFIKTVPATIHPIRGKKLKTADRQALLAVFEQHGNSAAVIAEVELILSTPGFASFSLKDIGNARIEQNGKKVTVSRTIETTPEQRIEVSDAKAAIALLRERFNEAVSMQQAQKSEAPLIARFYNMRHSYFGKLVA